MKEMAYKFAKLKYRLLRNNKEVMSEYFRKCGMKIGEGCNICCNIMTPEPFMIRIGNDVTIAPNVSLISHDNSINKIDRSMPNLYGYIMIGDNCFIGQNSVLMYGVTLASNIIVAAGSVVTSSFDEEKIIIGGNPARKIATWDDFYAKAQGRALGRKSVQTLMKTNPEKLVQRKVKK